MITVLRVLCIIAIVFFLVTLVLSIVLKRGGKK